MHQLRKPRSGRGARAIAGRGFVIAEYRRDVGKLTSHRRKAHALLEELEARPEGDRHEWTKGKFVVVERFAVPLGTRGLSALRGLLESRGLSVFYGRGPDESQGRVTHGTGSGPDAPKFRDLRAKLRELERSHAWDEQDLARSAYGPDAPAMLRACHEWERTQPLSAEWFLSGRDFASVHLAFCDALADAGSDKAQDYGMGVVCWSEERTARCEELGRYSALDDAGKRRDSRTIVGQAPVVPTNEHKPRKALRNVVPGKPARPSDAPVYASHNVNRADVQSRLDAQRIAIRHAVDLSRYLTWLQERAPFNTSR